MKISLIVAASAGLLSFLSPCVRPLVPSYLAFVTGPSLSDLRRPGRATRRGLVLNAMGFIVGFSVVFVAMGAAVTVVGGWLLSYRGLVQQIGRSVIFLFGLYLIGILRLPPFMSGPYSVYWQIFTADGHLSYGRFSFQVTERSVTSSMHRGQATQPGSVSGARKKWRAGPIRGGGAPGCTRSTVGDSSGKSPNWDVFQLVTIRARLEPLLAM